MQSGCDSCDTCSRVNSPLSLEVGEKSEVSEVEGRPSNTTEGGISEDLLEGTKEDLRPVKGDSVGDLHNSNGIKFLIRVSLQK